MSEDRYEVIDDREMPERREFILSSLAGVAATGVDVPPTQSPRRYAAWQRRRRHQLWGLLGDLPWNHKPGPPKLRRTEKGPGYTLEHLELDLNGIEKVPAILLIPDRRQPKAPGMLYIHWHGATIRQAKKSSLPVARFLPRMHRRWSRRELSLWPSIVGVLANASGSRMVGRESGMPSRR